MKPKDFNVQTLIETLQGTCLTLAEGIRMNYGEDMEENDLTSEDHEAIDNEIFLCDECGWWCENCEKNEDIEDEQFCTDCRPSYD